MKNFKFTAGLGALLVGTALLLTAVPKAAADDDGRTRCQQRAEKAERHYRQEVREHGRDSRQADQAKAKLNETWDRCYSQAHGWYDPQTREWRTDRDWDHNYDWDHDRDNDRDHDHDHDH